ncbi:MAG TPA: ABC transporter permease [Polyangiaceae bacterium]|jgi:putative ABC transport system permease protein
MSLLLTAIRLAFSAILRNKLRAGLTVLGILIGVSAVVAVTALAQGARALVGGSLAGFAANAVYVHPVTTQQSGARSKATGRLTEADGRAIAREASSVSGVGYWLNTTGQVVYGDKNVSTTLIGTNLPYFPIRKWEVTKGEAWTEADELFKTKVCVIGSTTRDKLFGEGVDPVGRTIRVGKFPYRIIGLLGSRGSFVNQDQDDRVMMPIGSFRSRILHTSPGRLDQLIIGATEADTVEHAVKQVTSILRQRHRIAEGGTDDFEVNTQAQMQETIGGILQILSYLLMGVATISLIVGGIGVMNIMLVSVAERTREIGIRMSIGAREWDVLLQFLVEAVVLSLVGGVIGMVCGISAVAALGHALDWPLTPGFGAMSLAVGTSAFIGLVFGFLPARRAAKLDPIEALRVD